MKIDNLEILVTMIVVYNIIFIIVFQNEDFAQSRPDSSTQPQYPKDE